MRWRSARAPFRPPRRPRAYPARAAHKRRRRPARRAGRLAELAYELPCVKGVEQVDVARRAGEYSEWEWLWALRGEEAADRRRLLVWVAPVFERLHCCATLAELALHPFGDCRVICGCVREGLERIH
eukprot:scaffold75678_cov31-Tisochrysis_lutea.AAC.1